MDGANINSKNMDNDVVKIKLTDKLFVIMVIAIKIATEKSIHFIAVLRWCPPLKNLRIIKETRATEIVEVCPINNPTSKTDAIDAAPFIVKISP